MRWMTNEGNVLWHLSADAVGADPVCRSGTPRGGCQHTTCVARLPHTYDKWMASFIAMSDFRVADGAQVKNTIDVKGIDSLIVPINTVSIAVCMETYIWYAAS